MSLEIILGIAASVVTVAGGIVAALHYFRRRNQAAESVTADGLRSGIPKLKRPEPLEFELLPLSFDIALNSSVPRIHVWFYGINYLREELVLTSVQVSQLYLSGGLSFENITTSEEIHVPAQCSKLLFCRRPLVDSEVRAIKSMQPMAQYNATVTVHSRGLRGKKFVQYWGHLTKRIIKHGKPAETVVAA